MCFILSLRMNSSFITLEPGIISLYCVYLTYIINDYEIVILSFPYSVDVGVL